MEDSELDFREIYADYQPRILRYLARLAGEAEAEDLVQEVFIKVDRGLKTFRGESQLSTWLYRIATNTAIDKFRSASYQHEADLGWLDISEETEIRDAWSGQESLSVERQVMRKERYECYVDFMKRLPPNYRAVVVLSELEELNNNEIAEILGLSLDVVKIRLHRGRARLLQELKTNCRAEDWL
jgi:RNA polymerase sigma-70 factor (ECF subfamily)